MDNYTGGSVSVFYHREPLNIAMGTASHFFNADHWLARQEARERHLKECADNFPLEGMSGEWIESHGSRSLHVWRTGQEADESLDFDVAQCTFCDAESVTLSVHNDYVSANVCQECLGKMFDVHGGAK